MTRQKALAIVVNARERRRNLAAGKLAQSERDVESARHEVISEEREHEERMDESMAKLVDAGSPYAFMELESERYFFAANMKTAQNNLTAAQQFVEQHRGALRTEERALRQAEALLDRERSAANIRINKAEQTALDERTATATATAGRGRR